MTPPIVAPFGSWQSPISSRAYAQAQMLITETRISAGTPHWVEVRPQEGGRSVLMRMTDRGPEEALPSGFSVRSRVHEYGGGAYSLIGSTIVFSNYNNHKLYPQDPPFPPMAGASPGSPGIILGSLGWGQNSGGRSSAQTARPGGRVGWREGQASRSPTRSGALKASFISSPIDRGGGICTRRSTGRSE